MPGRIVLDHNKFSEDIVWADAERQLLEYIGKLNVIHLVLDMSDVSVIVINDCISNHSPLRFEEPLRLFCA